MPAGELILNDQLLQNESMLDAFKQPWWVWALVVGGVVGIWMVTEWWEWREGRAGRKPNSPGKYR